MWAVFFCFVEVWFFTTFWLIYTSVLPTPPCGLDYTYMFSCLFSLKSLGKEMEASSEGEKLTSPFVAKIYDISNAALFYAHNGRLDRAQEQLTGQSRKEPREIAAGDKTASLYERRYLLFRCGVRVKPTPSELCSRSPQPPVDRTEFTFPRTRRPVIVEAGSELMASDLKSVDDASSRDGVRQDRVSGSLEYLIKARAFVHFVQTGENKVAAVNAAAAAAAAATASAAIVVGGYVVVVVVVIVVVRCME